MQTSDIKNLRVAIVGAGYAGASTAKALSLLGADVTVYEQAPAIKEVGAGIGLRPATLQCFRDWGSFTAIAAVSSPSEYFEILTPQGELILREEWPGNHDYPEDNRTRMIHRGDFIDSLLGVLPVGMLHLGRKLARIDDQGDHSTLHFENGEAVTADLVIGADGIRSVVRQQLFSIKAPVFSGEHAYRAVFSASELGGMVVDDNFRMFIGDNGAKVYLLPLRHRGQVSFDITAPSDDPAWAPSITREQLVSSLDGFDERLRNVTRTIDLDVVNCRAAYDIDPVDNWHSDSVALIGDAAHSMLHHQGQGANSAILDAKGIATALVEADSVAAALALYQATRKPETDKLQRISREGWDAAAVDDVFPGQHVESGQS